jgi:pyruvate carboxylase
MPRRRKRPSPAWTARCANSASAGWRRTSNSSINLLKHPTFLNDTYTTKFIDTTPELFNFKKRRKDRATKILTYIADITVNGHPETAGRPKPPCRGAPRSPRR